METSVISRRRKRAEDGKRFHTIDGKDETLQMMMEIVPLLITSGYRTWNSILLTHGEYPCHCVAQTFWYPKEQNLC